MRRSIVIGVVLAFCVRAAAQRAPSDEWSVYDVESGIGFDTLEGVATDPATGAWWLFGRRGDPDRFVRIPYLDHLATALECRSPRFSLEWTRDSDEKVARALAVGIAKAHWNTFDAQERLSAVGAAILASVGAQARRGDDRYDVLAALVGAARPEAEEPLRSAAAVLRALEARQELAAPLAELIASFDYEYSHREAVRDREVDAFWTRLLAKVAELTEEKPDRYAEAYTRRRQAGGSPEMALAEAFNRVDGDAHALLNRLHRDANRGQLAYLDADVARELLGVEPRVYPVFKDLPERSLLAKVAFDADVLLKTALHRPDLAERIPGWKTQIAWEHARNADTAARAHVWIAADSFELVESRDGRSMRFGRTPVRFHMRRRDRPGGESLEDPVLAEYAREISGHFDALAREFEAFHEVRECLKIVAVARWLQKQKFSVRLPRAGRGTWTPPRDLPGAIHVGFEAKASFAIITIASGGVDLTSEESWKLSQDEMDDLRDAVASDPNAALPAPPVNVSERPRDKKGFVKLTPDEKKKIAEWKKRAEAYEAEALKTADWRKLEDLDAKYSQAGMTADAQRVRGAACRIRVAPDEDKASKAADWKALQKVGEEYRGAGLDGDSLRVTRQARDLAAKDPAQLKEWQTAVYDGKTDWSAMEKGYCNKYAETVFKRAGVPTDALKVDVADGDSATTKVVENFAGGRHKESWASVTAADAQKMANDGSFVIALAPPPPTGTRGHIAIVAPDNLDEFSGKVGNKTYTSNPSYPLVRDQVARNESRRANWRWQRTQLDGKGDDEVKYYVYSPKKP